MRYNLLGGLGENAEVRRAHLLSDYLQLYPKSIEIQLAVAKQLHASDLGVAYVHLGQFQEHRYDALQNEDLKV